jgi:hypothetical protein
VVELIKAWAERALPSWQEKGKVQAPRILLAKLALERDVPEVNAYLQKAEPWAGIGSTWTLRRSGDYDFSLPGLTAILYKYGDRPELLYPETRRHLLNVLLNQDGAGFNTTVPGSLGLVTETENHILMTEGSRYLKNQWLSERGAAEYNNTENGLERKLVAFIREMEEAGPYEFNSDPYSGYTIMALLTLEAFAHDPVASAARSLLDRMNWEYALGSMQLRRYPPFRRQPRRADKTDLRDHPHTAVMHIWLARALNATPPGAATVMDMNDHHAVYAALMPYRLAAETVDRAMATDRRHYVRIGRGPDASPELHAAGPGYLLSAGGTGRPKGSLIVARPIVLLLNDGAVELSEVFTIGAGGDYRSWNNTGVLPNFAVGRGPLQVPSRYQSLARGETWSVYHAPGVLIGAATYSSETDDQDGRGVAALYLQSMENEDDVPGAAAGLQRNLERLAPGTDLGAGRVTLPDGREIAFDLSVGPDEWVIREVNGAATQRSMISWPRLSGSITQ